MHFFQMISLGSQQKCQHQHFSEEEGNDIFSHISLEFGFTYRKANMFTKILKLHGKRYKKYFWIQQIRCNSAFNVSDSLPLVQLKYSLNNTLSSQPETRSRVE